MNFTSDLAAALVAPVVMAVILLTVDWRFGLAAMLGVVIAFVVQFAMYGKSRLQSNDGSISESVGGYE